MSEAIQRPTRLVRKGTLWVGQFEAMASPCEILMSLDAREVAEELLQLAASEAWRVEQKYSRYRDDGIVPRINNSNGQPVRVDPETAQLLDFAWQCYTLSEGLFDITSGILRKAWSFQAGAAVPTAENIAALMPFIGLDKAHWQSPDLTLPAGMQIDFGGIGKEYAVDRTLAQLQQRADVPLLVNFGGDIACNRCPDPEQPWRIGIEAPSRQGEALEMVAVQSGALATSGSSYRYLLSEGRRYGHVLNPRTGWPVEEPPLSVTVAASTCTEAGMLATFAMLHGRDAEAFLEKQEVRYWLVR